MTKNCWIAKPRLGVPYARNCHLNLKVKVQSLISFLYNVKIKDDLDHGMTIAMGLFIVKWKP